MCHDCGKEDIKLHEVIVFDLTDRDPGKMGWGMCQSCLETKNLWCMRHGLKVMLFMPDLEMGDGMDFPVFAFCWQCCRDEIKAVDSNLLSDYVAMVRDYYEGEDLEWILQMGQVAEQHSRGGSMSEDEHVLFGAAIVGAITRRDLSQTLIALSSEGNDATGTC